MILIVDNGATKSEWHFIQDNVLKKSLTLCGYNPFTGNIENKQQFFTEIKENIDVFDGDLFFYSTGVGQKHIRTQFRNELMAAFKQANVFIETDLTAAGRAMYKNEQGIIAILGTGANAGWYDGKHILHQPKSLGFMLGDEGSGAYIGKHILKDYLENRLPKDIQQHLSTHYFNIDKAEIIQNIYQNYSGTDFGKVTFAIKDYFDFDYFNHLLNDAFEAFFTHIISRVKHQKERKISFIGSIAYAFQQNLIHIAQKHHYEVVDIQKNTTQKLIDYHIA